MNEHSLHLSVVAYTLYELALLRSSGHVGSTVLHATNAVALPVP